MRPYVSVRLGLVRLTVVALMALAIVGSDAARSQIADEPPATATEVRIEESPDQPPIGEGGSGLAVTGDGEPAQSRLGITSADVVSTECPGGAGSRTDLGLLEHSSLHSYCHGITGPGG